jgi:uncharacterized protein (DUF488 family)
MKLKLFTIGFTKHSAENFFTKLRQEKVQRIIDTRLNNSSQLSGFAKRDDLKFFLKEILSCDYQHDVNLAPEAAMLKDFQENRDWSHYEKQFIKLLKKRKIETLDKALFNNACLLCSEHLPHHCHRRLVAEYLQSHWRNVEIIHL